MNSSNSSAQATASEIIALEKTVRRFGGVMFVDTDGRLYGFPANVFADRPSLDKAIKDNSKGITEWLKILASMPQLPEN